MPDLDDDGLDHEPGAVRCGACGQEHQPGDCDLKGSQNADYALPTWDQVRARFNNFDGIANVEELALIAYERGDYVFDSEGVVQRKVDL